MVVSEDDVALVNKMLDVDRVEVTDKMIKYFKRSDIFDYLVGLVARKNSTCVVVDSENGNEGMVEKFLWRRKNESCDTSKYTRFVHNSFLRKESGGEEENELVKKSYLVMCMLCGIRFGVEDEGLGGDGGGFGGGEVTIESNQQSNREIIRPTQACLEVVRYRVGRMVAQLFDTFEYSSNGNLFHACKMLDVVMRFHAHYVLESFILNKSAVKGSLVAMLEFIHYPWVSELFLTLLCPLPTSQQEKRAGFYQCSGEVRAQYFRILSNMDILYAIAQHIWVQDAPQQHKAAAAELLECVVQRFAAVEHGLSILESLVRSPELLRGMMMVACGEEYKLHEPVAATADDWLGTPTPSSNKNKNKKKNKKQKGKGKKKKKNNNKKVSKKEEDNDDDENEEDGEEEIDIEKIIIEEREHVEHSLQRDAALDALRSVIDLATKNKIPGIDFKEYSSFMETLDNYVDCQLFPISERIYTILEEQFASLCHAIADPKSYQTEDKCTVPHTTYSIKQPFSNYRLELMKLIVVCVAHKPETLLNKISLPIWKTLVDWFLDYPHCNLYHVTFTDLIQILVTTNNSTHSSIKFIFDDCLLLSKMIDHYMDENQRTKTSVSGHILRIGNILRLQSLVLNDENHPFTLFLNNSEKWTKVFTPIMIQQTKKMVELWKPSDPACFVSSQPHMIKDRELIDSLVNPAQQIEIGLGSDFANQLGFKSN